MKKKLIPEEVLIKLGNRIKEVRIEKGLTARSVAHKSDMDENNYSRYEKGKVNLSLETLVRICNALEVEIKDLF